MLCRNFFNYNREKKMKKVIMHVASVLVLGIASSPVFANVAVVPTPDIMSLFGIGALAVYIVNKINK